MIEQSTTSTLTIGELVVIFNTHAERHYRRRDGTPTREHRNFASVLKSFETFASKNNPAHRINKHQVRAWLDQLAADQLTRTYINQSLSKLRFVIRWAADLDHIPAGVDHELRLVRSLQRFRTNAKESVPRKPPVISEFVKLYPFLPAHWRDVLQLCLLTGCRPGELLDCLNSEVHLDDFPRLVPSQHKTAHKGKHRIIPLSAATVPPRAIPASPRS